MPVSRMRMRPWLESRIDSNTIAGLVWVNKVKKYDHLLTTIQISIWTPQQCSNGSAMLSGREDVLHPVETRGSARLGAHATEIIKRCKSRDSRKRKVKTEETDAHEMHTEMTQENTIDSTVNLSTVSPSNDTPAYEVEIANCPEELYISKFQVSPVHSTDLEENEAIFELTRQLERESTQWLQNNFCGKGFLANEVATTESLSPESQWSESSGEELEFRLYTELTPDLREDSLCTYTELWNSSSMPQTMCPL
uniref:Uncharacterized protein n=1 Tax=Cyprinus carpio TaxID=7962 RepID=A0A8C2JQE0_CYPCA